VDKTSVYLSEEDRRQLAHLARVTGRSQAEIIREALAAYELQPSTDREFALAGCLDGPDESIADIDEDELFEGFGH
jgi:predicted transcriptional regulator